MSLNPSGGAFRFVDVRIGGILSEGVFRNTSVYWETKIVAQGTRPVSSCSQKWKREEGCSVSVQPGQR